MRARIKDIANALGLSESTVQSVLRERPGFKETTRQLVFKKAEELHYQPNWLASSLATRKTHVLGVAVPNLARPFFPAVMEGIDSITYPADYNIAVFNTAEDPSREDKGIAAFLGRQVDGLIIASAHDRRKNGAWRLIRRSGVPFVLIDRFFRSAPYVGADNERVGFMATKHLISQGYRSIAHLTASMDLAPGHDRHRGYLRALRTAGIRVLHEHVAEIGANTVAGGYTGAKRLLEQSRRPDAIFASIDFAALGAMQAVREAGLRMPEDFGVIGVGNIPYNEHLRTPLSSVDLHPIEVGRSAASMLLGMINGEPPPQKAFCIEPTLVVRASSSRTTNPDLLDSECQKILA
jgi:LacI family transcriptional regulator